MRLSHQQFKPHIHESAYVAPNAIICGDVTIGENGCVLFGAIIVAEGGPIRVGLDCIIMEQVVIRGTRRHPVRIGNNVLVGPRSYLTGCTVEDGAFIATGSTIFNGAKIGAGAEVRINGVVHLNSRLLPEMVVPIGWVAVGDPAKVLPPKDHDQIWGIQDPMSFTRDVFGLERARAEKLMPELTRRYSQALKQHQNDKRLGQTRGFKKNRKLTLASCIS